VSAKQDQPKLPMKTRVAKKRRVIVASKLVANIRDRARKNQAATMRNHASGNKSPKVPVTRISAAVLLRYRQEFQHITRYRLPARHVTMSQEQGRDECARKRL